MVSILFITFREFLEAWLIVGLFLGLSKQLQLGRGREMWMAVVAGMFIAIIIPVMVFVFGGRIRGLWDEGNVDFVQGCLMVIASIAIATVALSLHSFFKKDQALSLQKARGLILEKKFDIALCIAIILSIVREGLEVGLFALSIVLVTPTPVLFGGLTTGFMAAGLVGIITMLAYERLPIKRILTTTEYGIMFVGAAMFKNGVSKFLKAGWQVDLSEYLSIPLKFLPDREGNVIGHLLNSVFGVEVDFSVAKMLLLLSYIGIVYYFVFWKPRQSKTE
ncbi:MAG: FTR1 family protein [bacterium]|nr:FTR1 family protein [bacterium]